MSICRNVAGPPQRIIIVSGWAYETRILADGRRQIFSFLLPGDAVDVGDAASMAQRAVVSLTRLQIIDAPTLVAAEPEGEDEVSGAIQEAIRQREERVFDNMVRIGRLNSKERVLHLLLELHDRLDALGLVKENSFRLPVTQEVFADALGLSVVHINRTLQQLRREGLIQLKSGSVTLTQRQRLAAFACYEAGNPETMIHVGAIAR